MQIYWLLIFIIAIIIVLSYHGIKENFDVNGQLQMTVPFTPTVPDLPEVYEGTTPGTLFDFDIHEPYCDFRCQCRAVDNILKHMIADNVLTEEEAQMIWKQGKFDNWCRGVEIY